jgi:hypothetical protein
VGKLRGERREGTRRQPAIGKKDIDVVLAPEVSAKLVYRVCMVERRIVHKEL